MSTFFAGNGTIKSSFGLFFFFVFEFCGVRVVVATCYMDELSNRNGTRVPAFRMSPSPKAKTWELMKACAGKVSPQGSHVLHSRPPALAGLLFNI